MTTQQDTQELFASLTPTERSRRVAIAYGPDKVELVFGSVPNPQITLSDEQVTGLPQEWQDRYQKARAENAVRDCTLLAGEETEIVAQGSLYWCKQCVGRLPYKHLPHDPHSGKGAWIITRAGETLAEGVFDRDCAY